MANPQKMNPPASITAPREGLGFGFGTLLFLMLFLTLVGIGYMEAAQERLDTIVNNHMAKIELATRMRTAARERTVSLQKIILLTDPFERDEQWMLFNSYATDFVQARTLLLDMGLTNEELSLLKRQGKLTGVAVPLQMQVVNLVSEGKMKQAHEVLQQAIPAQDQVLEQLAKLYHLQEHTATAAVTQTRRDYDQARFAIVALSTAAIALGLYIAVLVLRRTRKADIALHHEKERAQVTLHSIAEAVIRTDSSGVIEYLNPVAEKLTGWLHDEALGRRLSEVLNVLRDASQGPAVDPVARVLAEKKVVTGSNDLVLVSRNDKQHAIDLTAAPIHDYEGAIAGVVIVFKDNTEVRALGRELTYQATHDALTGLMNRIEFDRHLQQALESARANGPVGTLCYLDLDLFKVINDTCGHLAGDELLKQLSVLLKTKVRRGDLVARLGGDEFAVLLRECSLDDAAQIADEMRSAVKGFRFVWEDKSFEVGVSVGILRVAPDSGDLNDVYRAADVACHAAKEEGRNRIHVFRPDDVTYTQRKGEINWAQRINQAISENLFLLYAQCIVPLHANQPIESGSECEVLIRMKGENGDIVQPSSFLPAAERYHMMPTIDRWVIRTAFTSLSEAKLDAGAFCLNINLSGQSLCDPEFLDFVMQQLDEYKIHPPCVCFEITETAAVTNMSRAIQFITKLKAAGCRFALDDFGSGLSSFAYLKNMKVDSLKIDGAFIRDITNDTSDLAMVNSINQVAHTMGIETIAEYVETNEILETLKNLGIDYVQGYALARPAPLGEVIRAHTTYRTPKKIRKSAV